MHKLIWIINSNISTCLNVVVFTIAMIIVADPANFTALDLNRSSKYYAKKYNNNKQTNPSVSNLRGQ